MKKFSLGFVVVVGAAFILCIGLAGCSPKEVPDEKLVKPGEILNTVPPNAKGTHKGE